MSNTYDRVLTTPSTQREQDRPDQVRNNAGGFVFTVGDRTRLERFLILGTAGGTYYATERDLTKQNYQFLIDLIARYEVLVWQTIKEISQSGRAYRNSPAIFALALLFKYGKIKDGPQTREEYTAKNLLPFVCRTSTHLFEFIRYVNALGGWSRSLRAAVAAWYENKSTEGLAYQVVKYRQRDGYTHTDAMRLSHPRNIDPVVGNFVLGKTGLVCDGRDELDIIRGFISVQESSDVRQILSILDQPYGRGLPWEAIPTQFLKSAEVWKSLFYNGQVTGQALVRNITRLARIGAFNDMVFARDYAIRLTDEDMIAKTRLHPIQYLLAAVVHTSGQFNRGRGSGLLTWASIDRHMDWTPSAVITDALNDGFYLAFKYTQPANKRTMVSLDVSASMSSAASGLDLTCAQLGAAMAMSIARGEPYYLVNCFSSKLKELPITPNMTFAEVMRITSNLNFGSTDCSLPILEATKNKIEVDTFFVFTDNETWAGQIHPYQALQTYRQKSGIAARLVVAAATATEFSIADPTDSGMLDLAGGDANMPKIVADFSAGRI
jgi:60 kDa SS-A/Ro ribonucleoprotein